MAQKMLQEEIQRSKEAQANTKKKVWLGAEQVYWWR